MPISEETLRLETQDVGTDPPTLGAAFDILHAQWFDGERDRELALHLLFLSWYLHAEPSWLTGVTDSSLELLSRTFNEVHEWLLPDGASSSDAEAVYVAHLGAMLVPWALGDETLWTGRSEMYLARYRQLVPDGFQPTLFEGRGLYGSYLAHMSRRRVI